MGRWLWTGILAFVATASVSAWGREARPSHRTPALQAPAAPTRGGTSSVATGFFATSAPSRGTSVRSEATGPEEEPVPVPLKGGCGTEVLLTTLRPPLFRPAFVPVASEEAVEALERAWDAYYGDAWRRLYPRMDVHPHGGPIASEEIRGMLLRSHRHPWPRTPVPPRFRGHVPYYYYYYHFRPYYPFYYYRRFFFVPFFRVYPFYFFYDPFFYPFYPLYRFYFFYGYPYGWWDDGYRAEERRARGLWGEVWFDVRPEDARIYVDGQLWGRAEDLNGWWKSRRIRAGEHRVRVEHDRYPPQEFSVRVPPDETVAVRVDLRTGDGPSPARGPAGRAVVWVWTQAERPQFLLDGQAVPARYDAARRAWAVDATYGTHVLEVRADGDVSWVQPIRVTSPETDLWVQSSSRTP